MAPLWTAIVYVLGCVVRIFVMGPVRDDFNMKLVVKFVVIVAGAALITVWNGLYEIAVVILLCSRNRSVLRLLHEWLIVDVLLNVCCVLFDALMLCWLDEQEAVRMVMSEK